LYLTVGLKQGAEEQPGPLNEQADSFEDTSSADSASRAFRDSVDAGLDRNATPSNLEPLSAAASYDEFMNPVDKQIAACMFQMSSADSSMLEDAQSTASEMDDSNSFCQDDGEGQKSPSQAHSDVDREGEPADAVDCRGEEWAGRGAVERPRQASFRAKTREGLRSVFSKLSRAVKGVQKRQVTGADSDQEAHSGESDSDAAASGSLKVSAGWDSRSPLDLTLSLFTVQGGQEQQGPARLCRRAACPGPAEQPASARCLPAEQQSVCPGTAHHF